MKIFLILCVIIFARGTAAHTVHLSHAQKEKANLHTAECIKESGVKPELLTEAKKGVFENDEALKNFTLCFFKKSGILSGDAKLNVEVALEKIPTGIDKASAKKLLEECKMKTGTDHADTAFEIYKCYYRSTKQHVSL